MMFSGSQDSKMYFTTEIYPDPVNGFLKNNVAVFRSAMTDINLFCTCVSVFLFPLVFFFFSEMP